MSHLKKITKLVVNVFTGILLVILVMVIYGKVVITFGKNSYPNYFGYTVFEVASGSMEPTLRINDAILVKITQENLNKGDIIAFYGENAVITHRILYIDDDIITVKGDNNNIVDKPINRAQVIGKIVKVFPRLGIWKKVITDPKILIAIFITLLLFDFALSYSEKNKVDDKEKPLESNDKKEVEEVIATQIVPEEKKEVKKKVIEPEELLEFTRKIDVDEINKLLEGTEYKLEKKEINNLKKEISKVEDKKNNNNVTPKLSKKEKKFIEYTLRLDLNEIQKNINKNTK